MNQPDSKNWQIGQVIFDTARRQLQLGELSVYVEPKLFTLLQLLLESPHNQVSRDQLITDVWLGRVVSESAINRAISLLRKAFNTLDPDSNYIETLPKVGYRLAMPIQLISADVCEPHDIANAQYQAEQPAINKDMATNQVVEAPYQAERLPPTTSASSLKLGASRWLWGFLLLSGILFLAWHLHRTWSSPNWLNTTQRPVYLTFDGGSETSVSVNSTHIFYQRQLAGSASELWLKPITDTDAPAERIAVTAIKDASQRKPGEVALVVSGRLSKATLSPDGQWLVFAEYQSKHCQVFLLSLSALQMRSLFDCPPDSEFQASWQADSSAFFYRQRQNKTKPYAVHRFTLATAKQQQLTAPASDHLAGSLLVAAAPRLPKDEPQSSSRTAAVAILRYLDTEHTELLLMPEATWQPKAITVLPMKISNVQWIQADLLLLSAGSNLYQYHLPSKQLAPLYSARADVESFFAVNNHLFVAEQKQQSLIRRVSIRDGQSEQVVALDGLNVMPRLRGSDQRLFFLNNMAGQLQVWQQAIGKAPSMLSELPHPSFTRLALSSDQRSIVFSQLGAVYQLTIADGSTRQLLSSEYKANVVNLDNNLNSLIFSSERSGDWQLWQFDLAQNQLHQLTQDGGYSGIVHENNLYFTRYHQPGLWRKPMSGDDAELLIPDLDVVNWLNWHIDQQHIYFYRPSSGIWRYTIANQQQQLLMPMSPDFVHQFHVEGEFIYFVERRKAEGNIAQLILKTED